MKKRIFCVVLAALLVCSSAVLNPQSAMALVVSSKSCAELQQSGMASCVEGLRAGRKIGKRMQQLGYSSSEVEARLEQLSKEDILYLAGNLNLIREGTSSSAPTAGEAALAILLIFALCAAAASC